jgi:hypothetical protein
MTIDGFGLVTGFIELLQYATTGKDYVLTVIHTSQITIGPTSSSQSVTVFTSRCSVVASNGGLSASSGFPNCPRPQLPASHSNSSEQLNSSGYLINSLTHQPTTDTVLARPTCNISAPQKTPFLCCSAIVAVETCLFAEPLLTIGCCIIAYFAVIA